MRINLIGIGRKQRTCSLFMFRSMIPVARCMTSIHGLHTLRLNAPSSPHSTPGCLPSKTVVPSKAPKPASTPQELFGIMADCSASGTAIDRVIQLAVASSSAQGHSNGAAAISAAAGGTTRAISNFITTSSASMTGGYADTFTGGMMGGGGSGGQQIMPMAPIQTIGGHQQYRGSVNSALMIQQQQQPRHGMTQYQMPVQRQMMSMHHHTAPQQQNMMSMQHQHQMQQQHHQQQQMMMMQQMQMAAMVQYQNQQQQQYQQQHHSQQQLVGSNQKSNEINATTSNQLNVLSMQQIQVDDDVATVSVEDEVFLHHHEGITNDASIERLAQAWRDAETEYAQEFDDNEDHQGEYSVEDAGYYNVSEMSGGRYSVAGDAGGSEAMMGGGEPQYQFSDASRNYGCIQTTTTDVAPQSLTYPQNLYAQGMAHFEEGNISEAILCFESTLRNIDPEHADAWRMLGKCHTENDEDQRAITCWLRSLERDPFSPETLLALGVSYVNELNHERAIEMLKGWVENHPLYAGMIDDNNIGSSSVNNLVEGEDLYNTADARLQGGGQRRMKAQAAIEMRDVERLMLRALEYDRTADAAADVYEALGVVYNVSRDYDAAADAFRKAIEVRPMDYQLRNKLGATLANNNLSYEALPEYRTAISLKPKYARGWLNMAISQSNLHNYNEATRCYLQTLSLNPDASHVWSYLRIALTCDEKWDLLPFAASQNISAFCDHYDFVEY